MTFGRAAPLRLITPLIVLIRVHRCPSVVNSSPNSLKVPALLGIKAG
jgi:hypothetical protein